jgi:hypothetical protein
MWALNKFLSIRQDSWRKCSSLSCFVVPGSFIPGIVNLIFCIRGSLYWTVQETGKDVQCLLCCSCNSDMYLEQCVIYGCQESFCSCYDFVIICFHFLHIFICSENLREVCWHSSLGLELGSGLWKYSGCFFSVTWNWLMNAAVATELYVFVFLGLCWLLPEYPDLV